MGLDQAMFSKVCLPDVSRLEGTPLGGCNHGTVALRAQEPYTLRVSQTCLTMETVFRVTLT